MIIDIRSHERYLNGHIENAVNIPFDKLFNHPSMYLDKEKEYLIYCDTGIKSQRLVNFLNKIGYNCVNIDGGYFKTLG